MMRRFTLAAMLCLWAVTANAQAGPALAFSVTGPEQTVFHWKTDKCDQDNIADAAARAFRDSSGHANLVMSAALNRRLEGPDLNHVKQDCAVIFKADESADPMAFDDEGWLESLYTKNGRDIYALASMDYHPGRHKLPCAQGSDGCWYSAIAAVKSHDGGRTFTMARDVSQRFVAGSPSPFDPRAKTVVGALVPTNIVSFEKAYYAMISVAADKAQKGGECLMRTGNLDDARSWRAWNGKDFSVPFVPPTAHAAAPPPDNICEPLSGLAYAPVRSLTRMGKLFIAIEADGGKPDGGAPSRVVAQTSPDLLHWSAPVTVMKIPIYHGGGKTGTNAYYYPSLIDPASASPSFETVGIHPYLYLTKYTYGAGINRDLVRYPLQIAGGQPQ
jgi:hypothetical protein